VLGASVSKRTIPGGATWDLVFEFTNPPASTGYTVEITFDVGCLKSSSQ
jgi:hypothetical protein